MTFFTESTYLVGPIRQQKHYTPYISTVFSELSDLQTPFFYPTLNNKIFYINLIFNTYLINKEENFCTLYSADNKLTIIKNTNIKEKMLFTVKIVEENEYLRVVEIYKYDSDKSVGYVCNGTVVKKVNSEKSKKTKKQNEECDEEKKSNKNDKKIMNNNNHKYTIMIGNKEFEFIAIREYQHNEKIKAMLVRKDINKEEKIIYREVDYFTNDKNNYFYVQVEKEDKKCYFCKGTYIKGLINKTALNREIKIGEMLRVKVIQENNFKFVFGLETTKNTETYNTNCSDNTIVMNKRIFYDLENGLDVISNQNKGDMTDNNNEFNLKPGMIKEAIIKNYHKIHGTFVVVDGYTGIMKKCETSKDYVSDIERYLIGKKTVKGMIYNVNEKEKKFMFSVRKYETRANDFDGDTEMSVPFKKHKKQHNENEETDDKNNDECDSIEINKIENNAKNNKKNKNEVTEDKCNDECETEEINKTCVYKFVNSDYNIFYVNNIKNEYENIPNNNEKKAYIENKIQNSKENDKYEFYCILLAKLMILEKENAYEIVKKYYKTNTEAFFTEVIETLENYNIENNKEYQNIYKLYYKTYKNEFAYQKLVKYNLNNKIEDDNIYKNEHKHLAIPILYELAPNEARVRTEKMLHKDYNAWKTYIETEIKYKSVNTIEYIRNLFRRVVENGFSVSETKDMFKKWLEFEKKNDGDCEEVTNKAKEYVEKINKA